MVLIYSEFILHCKICIAFIGPMRREFDNLAVQGLLMISFGRVFVYLLLPLIAIPLLLLAVPYLVALAATTALQNKQFTEAIWINVYPAFLGVIVLVFAVFYTGKSFIGFLHSVREKHFLVRTQVADNEEEPTAQSGESAAPEVLEDKKNN